MQSLPKHLMLIDDPLRKACADDAESATGAPERRSASSLADVHDLEMDRRGWAKMTAGCAVIAFGFLILWEIVVGAIIHPHINPTLRFLFFSRALFTAALVTAFALRFASTVRGRLETARLRLLADEARLAEHARRIEQTEGLAAILRIMGHEIRNPLNGMLLHCAILKRTAETLSGPARGSIDDVRCVFEGEIGRLNTLLDEYMAYGKAKSVSMSTAPIDLGEALREAAAVHRPAASERGLTLDVHVEASSPIVIEGDAGKLAQVFHNLIRNSLEATPDGGEIRLSAKLDGSYAMISIEDNGPGFSDPDAAFRPFFTTKPQGSGLGLAIVHDIVRAHRGEARAYNAASTGGAHVDVRLPRQVSR